MEAGWLPTAEQHGGRRSGDTGNRKVARIYSYGTVQYERFRAGRVLRDALQSKA